MMKGVSQDLAVEEEPSGTMGAGGGSHCPTSSTATPQWSTSCVAASENSSTILPLEAS